MTDTLTKAQRAKAMKAVKSQDTKPEMLVRRLVHSMGYRYRLHVAALPGRPDLVFPSRKKIILVNGCFWHQHQGCKRASIPSTNVEYWDRKLLSNRSRDQSNAKALKALGWQVMVIWECQTVTLSGVAQRISRFLDL